MHSVARKNADTRLSVWANRIHYTITRKQLCLRCDEPGMERLEHCFEYLFDSETDANHWCD